MESRMSEQQLKGVKAPNQLEENNPESTADSLATWRKSRSRGKDEKNKRRSRSASHPAPWIGNLLKWNSAPVTGAADSLTSSKSNDPQKGENGKKTKVVHFRAEDEKVQGSGLNNENEMESESSTSDGIVKVSVKSKNLRPQFCGPTLSYSFLITATGNTKRPSELPLSRFFILQENERAYMDLFLKITRVQVFKVSKNHDNFDPKSGKRVRQPVTVKSKTSEIYVDEGFKKKRYETIKFQKYLNTCENENPVYRILCNSGCKIQFGKDDKIDFSESEHDPRLLLLSTYTDLKYWQSQFSYVVYFHGLEHDKRDFRQAIENLVHGKPIYTNIKQTDERRETECETDAEGRPSGPVSWYTRMRRYAGKKSKNLKPLTSDKENGDANTVGCGSSPPLN